MRPDDAHDEDEDGHSFEDEEDEELELDAESLQRASVGLFLEECELPAADIASTIELAGAIAASYGSAVLRVEREPMGVSAMVLAPEAARAGAPAASGASPIG